MKEWKKPKYTIVGSAEALDINLSKYREWISRDFIPVEDRARSQGKQNKLSRINLFQTEAFRQLLDHGLSRDMAKKVIEYISGYDPKKPILVVSLKNFKHRWFKRGQDVKFEDFSISLDVGEIQTKLDTINL